MATKDGKKSGGRQKGTPNKLTKSLLDAFEDRDYNPVVEVLNVLEKEQPTILEINNYKKELIESGIPDSDVKTMVRNFSNDYLKIAAKVDIHMRFLEYIYPKRKAIEFKQDDDSEAPEFHIHFNKKSGV